MKYAMHQMGYDRVVLEDASRRDSKREAWPYNALVTEFTARCNFYTQLGFRPSTVAFHVEWTRPFESIPKKTGADD